VGAVDAPFGGGVFIADTSAWARAKRAPVAEEWRRAIVGGQIATCPIVAMEVLYTAQDATGFDERERSLATLSDVPINRLVTDAGIAALRELAHRRPLHHRLPLSDVLIAAAAQEARLGVLHYDRHFDRLAEVLSFESRWLAPPGSLD
jgi:predicted nucleic acid-binding protein